MEISSTLQKIMYPKDKNITECCSLRIEENNGCIFCPGCGLTFEINMPIMVLRPKKTHKNSSRVTTYIKLYKKLFPEPEYIPEKTKKGEKPMPEVKREIPGINIVKFFEECFNILKKQQLVLKYPPQKYLLYVVLRLCKRDDLLVDLRPPPVSTFKYIKFILNYEKPQKEIFRPEEENFSEDMKLFTKMLRLIEKK